MIKWKKLGCVGLCAVALAGCRPDTNQNTYTLLPFDVKPQESSLTDREVRLAQDYQYKLSTGQQTPEVNNTTATINPPATETNEPSRWAVKGGVTYPYSLGNNQDNQIVLTSGYNEPRGTPHQALDMNLFTAKNSRVTDADILSVTDGKVIHAGTSSSAGNWVVVQSTRAQGNDFYVIYMHMLNNSVLVTKGDTVTAGQKIGKEGNTGESQGAHLHLQVCEQKPRKSVLNSDGRSNYNPLLVLYGYNLDHTKMSELKSKTKGRFVSVPDVRGR